MALFYMLQMLWEVGYPPPISVILKSAVVIFFTYHRRPLVEWFATHNSI
jgi:hypothetical protein